jgi:5'-nucleotidase
MANWQLGRFPQVSNIAFEVDYSQPPQSRILSATIDNSPIDFQREYVLATRGYMGRGKDGYTSLLIEEEGGVAKEIVSEENGVLISTILRQYFLSLKVLGKWKHWGKSMGRKFEAVHKNLQQTHTFVEPTSPSTSTSAAPEHRSIASAKATDTKTPVSSDPEAEEDSDSDEEDGAVYDDSQPIDFTARELPILRKAIHKWWKLAGLKHDPKMVDELGESEFQVNWTKAIAPRLEDRIKEVKKGA